jgi:hypothetical protein
MAKIQQAFSSAEATTGSILSSARISAFGNSGLDMLAKGIGDLATGVAVNKKTADAIADAEKERKDILWTDRALSEYARKLTDFEVDPVNQVSPELLPSFIETAGSNVEAITEGAPSPEAAAQFREKARGVVDSRYARNAEKTAQNEMGMDLNSLETTWGTALSSYHQAVGVDAAAAATDLGTNFTNNSIAIMELYGQVAPELARKLVAKRTEDIALALVDKNPELAKKLVIGSEVLDEQSRQVLLGKLEKKKEEGSLILKEDFNLAREKTVIASQKTGAQASIPLSDYQQVYEGEQAAVMKQRDDAIIFASVSSHQFLGSVTGELPGVKQQKATDFEATLDTEDKMRAFSTIIQPALVRDQKLFDTDSVQWLTENNEQVQLLAKEIAAIEDSANTGIDNGPGVLPPRQDAPPDVDASAGTREQYYNTILKYQGYPVEGGNPTRFMNKPPGQRLLLTKQQANTYSGQINSGTIDDAVETIRSILHQYPNDELRAHAISDLTTLPVEKVKPEYQIAFQNAKQSWLPDYIGAIRGAKDTAEMSIIDGVKLNGEVNRNPTWASFVASIGGPQGQRSAELSGYRRAIETYAKDKMATTGVTASVAAEQAVAQILTSTMTPVRVRDTTTFGGYKQELWMPREMFGKIHDDDDLKDYGRRMGIALTEIHPDDIDPNMFPDYSKQSDPKVRRKMISQQITKTAKYYPDPGGLTYRVTVASAVTGKQIDLRNKDGKLFQLPIDKLPAYSKRDSDGTEHADNVLQFDAKRFRDGHTTTALFWNFTL